MANTFSTTGQLQRVQERDHVRVSSSMRRRSLSPTIDTGAAMVSFTHSRHELQTARLHSWSPCRLLPFHGVLFAPSRLPRPLPCTRFDAYPREALSRSTGGAVRRKLNSISASMQSLMSLLYAYLVVLLETYIKTMLPRAACIVGTPLSPSSPQALFNLQSSLLEGSFASYASNNMPPRLRLHLHRAEMVASPATFTW